jgi:hypothetical protein
VGNTLFIPFFLISVGMLIDFKLFFHDVVAIKVAVIMTISAITTKFLAAHITAKIFKYSNIQRNLIFSLSNAQAAATLAAVLVGYRIELLDKSILNGTIMMILITCVVSSFVMEKYGRMQALLNIEDTPDKDIPKERMLVALNRPQFMGGFLDVAVMLRDPSSDAAIHIVSVLDDDERAELKLKVTKEMLDEAYKHVSGAGIKVRTYTRIDLNIASGIINASRELNTSSIMLGWHIKNYTSDKFFGTKLEYMLEQTDKMIFAPNIVYNVNTTKRIILIPPKQINSYESFARWLKSVNSFAKIVGATLYVHTTEKMKNKIIKKMEKLKSTIPVEFSVYDGFFSPIEIARKINADDMLIIVATRRNSISYDPYMARLENLVDKYFLNRNFIFIYPSE